MLSIYIQAGINALSLGAVYATIAVGYALIFNILKFSNFSHSGVLVVTAYIGYVIQNALQTNFWVTLLLTAICGGLLALIVEFVAFRNLRLRKANVMLYFVSSITMGMLLENIITVVFGSAFVSYPVFFEPSFFRWNGIVFIVTYILMLAMSLLSLALLMLVLYKTRLGTAIRALSMDRETTSLMGVNVTLIIMATFFVSGMLGGVSGMFLAGGQGLYRLRHRRPWLHQRRGHRRVPAGHHGSRSGVDRRHWLRLVAGRDLPGDDRLPDAASAGHRRQDHPREGLTRHDL